MVSWWFVEPIWMEEFAAGIMSISELKVDIDILPPLARLGRKTILTLTFILSQLRQNITAMQLLTIGELSKKTGTTSVAIRHYERFGLICNVIRKSSGYRLYPEETISHIRFLKNSQSVGLSLEEIRELIHVQAQSGTTSEQVKTLIQDKLKILQAKEETIKAMIKALQQLEAACDGKRPLSQCPILESLYASNKD